MEGKQPRSYLGPHWDDVPKMEVSNLGLVRAHIKLTGVPVVLVGLGCPLFLYFQPHFRRCQPQIEEGRHTDTKREGKKEGRRGDHTSEKRNTAHSPPSKKPHLFLFASQGAAGLAFFFARGSPLELDTLMSFEHLAKSL